jgi:hypothetical protein
MIRFLLEAPCRTIARRFGKIGFLADNHKALCK